MSVIIRLQNLPWSANALDIRQYFYGLSIPEGGVHIVGGELGDAFIAFSTDEDARQAFERNNGKIKEVQIKLMLSSRTEMQRVIEAARSQSMAAYMPVVPPVAPAPAVTPAPVPVALPAVVPQVIPAVLPKKDDKDNDSDKERNEKRDKRRSRSRSRDRNEKSRDRDRRDTRRKRGDRSRSRSRERRERRRRDRSWSRERHHPKDQDRRISRERRRSDEKPLPIGGPMNTHIPKEQKSNMWDQPIILGPSPPSSVTGSLPINPNLEVLRHNLNVPTPPNITNERNHFSGNIDKFNRGDPDNWQYDGNMPPFARGGPDRNFSPNDRFCMNNHRPGSNGSFNSNNFPENGNRFHRNWQNNDGPKYYNARPDKFRERIHEQHENCCIRLHPFYGGFGEIRRFFHGLFIHNSGIKLLNDRYGKRTGWVFIRFVYPEGKQQALEKSGNFLRKQPIEVLHLDDEEFEKAVDRYRPPDYIENYDEEEDDVDAGSPNAYKSKHSSKHFHERDDKEQHSLENYTCLVVEDLPSYVKEQDILKIFSDYSLMSIIVVENRKQRKNQLAYVKFSNSEHAKKACEETVRHTLEGKPLSVKPCSDEEFEKINKQQNELMGTDEPQNERNLIKVESDRVCLTGLPLSTNERDITDFFCDVGIVPDKIHLISDAVGFTGKAFCQFTSLSEAQAAISKNGMYLGSGIVTVKSVPRAEIEEAVEIRPLPPMPPMHNTQFMNSNPRPPFFRNNFFNKFMGNRPMMRYNAPPKGEGLGPPGCTVLMENVPYKADLEEILDFFKNFDIPGDNVLRRFNPNGQPSGETKVIFKSPEDAQKAVQSRNREKIRDRVIYLSLC